MFKVYTTDNFKEKFERLDESDKILVRKIMLQLKEKGEKVGKPLSRKYFREKKFGGKRLYFLIYKNFMIVLAVAISTKKSQQKTIDEILRKIKEYEKFIRDKFN
jgi:DNA polymerase III delta prime subunit